MMHTRYFSSIRCIFISVILLVSGQTYSQDHYDAWHNFLQKYVSVSGEVSYKDIKKNKKDLDQALQHLLLIAPSNLQTKEQALAYWINVYNAFTIRLIVDNYPIKSILDLDGGKPWDVKWIKIDQKIYSLNDIEHEILRKKYKDERIHFTLNCASKSCPPLLNVAYKPDSVLAQMDKQTKAFINNPSFNTISSKTLHISKIFEWYKVDFKNVINFIGKYSTTKINPQSTINYRTYDWSLNGY